MVKEDLKALRINDILDKFPYEPQMDEVYGYTADNIEDWADLCEEGLEKYKSWQTNRLVKEKQLLLVVLRRGAIQSIMGRN